MTIATWEKASGLIHEIKKIDSVVEQIEQAQTLTEILAITNTLAFSLRDPIRNVILKQLAQQKESKEMELEKL